MAVQRFLSLGRQFVPCMYAAIDIAMDNVGEVILLHMLGHWEILLILVIVLLIFGGKKLKTLGSDLGQAIKGFRSTMKSEKEPDAAAEPTSNKSKSTD